MWGRIALLALLGTAPDLDLLLPIQHRAASHGLGAAVLVGVVAAAATRRWRLALAAGTAYATHILLDWLATDTSPPFGVMALWPLRQTYYESGLHLFHAISRRWGTGAFWTQNVRAITRELLLLLPPFLIVVMRTCLRRTPRGAESPTRGDPPQP